MFNFFSKPDFEAQRNSKRKIWITRGTKTDKRNKRKITFGKDESKCILNRG